MEVPRLRVQSELQLPASTTASTTSDPSHTRNLQHSSQQHQILNSRSEARDRTRNLMDPSQIHFHCVTAGTPIPTVFFFVLLFRAALEAYRSSRARSRIRATATAAQDLSCVCDLLHSPKQHWTPNPLSEARDRTHILVDTRGFVSTSPQQELLTPTVFYLLSWFFGFLLCFVLAFFACFRVLLFGGLSILKRFWRISCTFAIFSTCIYRHSRSTRSETVLCLQ